MTGGTASLDFIWNHSTAHFMGFFTFSIINLAQDELKSHYPIIRLQWMCLSFSWRCHFDGRLHNYNRGHWRRTVQNRADTRHPGAERIRAEIHVRCPSSRFKCISKHNKHITGVFEGVGFFWGGVFHILSDGIRPQRDNTCSSSVMWCSTVWSSAPTHTAKLCCTGIWTGRDTVSSPSGIWEDAPQLSDTKTESSHVHDGKKCVKKT